MSEANYFFHIPLTGKVDRENHIIKGVSLITGDLEAEGHALHVDDTTLDQLFALATKAKKITCKADHKGSDGKTFKTIVGYFTNFSKDTVAKKVRGDLHLLESDPQTPKIEEMAERMPENFGPSVAFKGPEKGEKVGAKNFARATKLISVDLVENPAANPDGMFSAVDTDPNHTMSKPQSQPTGAPTAPVTLESLAALITQQNQAIAALTDKVTAQEQLLGNLNSNPGDEPALDELANMSDAELVKAGFDVDKVRAAVDEAIINGELTVEGGEAGAPGAPAAAAPAAAATAEAGTALSALQREVHELRSARDRDIRLAAKADEDHAFEVLQGKVDSVIEFAKKTAKENETLKADNEALRTAIKTGHSFAGAATDDGVNLFAAKDAADGSFEKIVTVKFGEFYQGGKVPEVKARAQAIKFAIRNHPSAYSEYRARGGTINLQSK